MDENLQDRIDNYLLHRMSADESKAFEADMESDKQLREQYNYTRMVKKSLSRHAELQQMMSQWDDDISRERQSQSGPSLKPSRRTWLWASGIAAILVVGLIMINPRSTAIMEPSYSSIMDDGAARDGSSLSEIDRMLTNKQYAEALALIETAEKELAAAEATYSPTAIDSLNTEAKEQAIYEQTKLQRQLYDIAWMKANALVGLDRKAEAIATLDALRQQQGEYQAQADSLYNELTK